MKQVIMCMLLSLQLNFIQSQVIGGALSYKVLSLKNDYVKLRLLNKISTVASLNDTAKCSTECGQLIESQLQIVSVDRFDYMNQSSSAKIDSSVYCASSYPIAQNPLISFINGYRENDIVLPLPKSKSFDLKYKGGFINPNQDHLDVFFKLTVNLSNRTGSNVINTPPNLQSVDIFQTFFYDENNSYRLNITDADGDDYRCEFAVSKTICDTLPRCKEIHDKFKLDNCVLSLAQNSITPSTLPLAVDILVTDYYKGTNTPISSVPYFITINIIKNRASLLNSNTCNGNKVDLGFINQFNIDELKVVDGSAALKSFTIVNLLFLLVSLIYNNY